MNLIQALAAAAEALPEDRENILRAQGDPLLLLSYLSPEGAKRLLCWLLLYADTAADTLAIRWHHREEGREVVRQVFGEDLPSSARARLDSVLQVGLGEPDSSPEPSASNGRGPRGDAGFVSGIDPRGARWVFLFSGAEGEDQLFEVKLEGSELCEFRVQSVGAVRARAYLRGVQEEERVPIVEASPDSVRVLIAQAFEKDDLDPRFDKLIETHRATVANPPDEARSPGAFAREALDALPALEALSWVGEMILERKLGPWPPRDAVMRHAGDFLCRLHPSPDESPVVRAEVFQELNNLVFGWEGCRRWRYFLEESAYVFWKNGDELRARACLSAALSLVEGPRDQNPVVKAVLEVLFGSILRPQDEDPGASSG